MEKNLKNEEIRNKLPELLKSVKHLTLLTSGQCLIFNDNGEQIGDLQAEFTSGEVNIWLLSQIAEHATKFTIASFRNWMQDMDKDEFIRITHLKAIN